MKGAPLRQFTMLIAIAALAFNLQPVRAGSINWGTPTLISGDTNVSTAGTLLYAYGFGNLLVPGATVNGVTFAPFAVPNYSSGDVTVGDVTLSVNTEFFTDNSSPGNELPPFDELSTEYQNLLGSGISASANFSTLTLTLGGLSFGQLYQVQFWSNDSGALFNRWGGTTYASGNLITMDNSVDNTLGGVGQWVTGTFLANSSTQYVTIESSTPAGDYPVMNALQIRAVPEPSSALLLLAGVVVLYLHRHIVCKATRRVA